MHCHRTALPEMPSRRGDCDSSRKTLTPSLISCRRHPTMSTRTRSTSSFGRRRPSRASGSPSRQSSSRWSGPTPTRTIRSAMRECSRDGKIGTPTSFSSSGKAGARARLSASTNSLAATRTVTLSRPCCCRTQTAAPPPPTSRPSLSVAGAAGAAEAGAAAAAAAAAARTRTRERAARTTRRPVVTTKSPGTANGGRRAAPTASTSTRAPLRA
mmetsp:Transcript_30227/g.96458  ORF Transcript_30227/g.96458 Transcript_30227/m.96458 type:complete len:213 (-) Transcript_30227:127-765(-)